MRARERAAATSIRDEELEDCVEELWQISNGEDRDSSKDDHKVESGVQLQRSTVDSTSGGPKTWNSVSTRTADRWAKIDARTHPHRAVRGLAKLLWQREVSTESGRWLLRELGQRLPANHQAGWEETMATAGEWELWEQRKAVSAYIARTQHHCGKCMGQATAECRNCEAHFCVFCAGARAQLKCDICAHSAMPGDKNSETTQKSRRVSTKRGRHEGNPEPEVVSMHNLGQLFIGKVLDIRDNSSDEQQQVGETLTFQAQVQGWEQRQKEEKALQDNAKCSSYPVN